MKRPHETPEVRAQRLARIRSEIAAGTYETPDRLSAALDRMLTDCSDREGLGSNDAPWQDPPRTP